MIYAFHRDQIHSLISVFVSLIEKDPREQGLELDGADSPYPIRYYQNTQNLQFYLF